MTKADIIPLTLSAEEHSLIQNAAAMWGWSIEDFIKKASLNEAKDTTQEAR